jgi:hypothetical protein
MNDIRRKRFTASNVKAIKEKDIKAKDSEIIVSDSCGKKI